MNKNLWLNDVVYTYQWLYSSFKDHPSKTVPRLGPFHQCVGFPDKSVWLHRPWPSTPPAPHPWRRFETRWNRPRRRPCRETGQRTTGGNVGNFFGKDHIIQPSPSCWKSDFRKKITINPQVGLWFNVLLETMLKKTTVWYFQFDLNSWELAVLTVCEETG